MWVGVYPYERWECNVNHVKDQNTHRGQDGVTIVILRIRWTDDGDKDVAALATCISPKCLKSHLCPDGPSTECSRSVATFTYAYRVVGILGNDKQRINRCQRKSNCKSFSLEQSSEVYYKCINEEKIKFLFFQNFFFILRDKSRADRWL